MKIGLVLLAAVIPLTVLTGCSEDTTTVPDMVGEDLQVAQDTMQAEGFYDLTSTDASDEGRMQILDRNWQVCSQTPAGGTEASTDTLIAFYVVEDTETCP